LPDWKGRLATLPAAETLQRQPACCKEVVFLVTGHILGKAAADNTLYCGEDAFNIHAFFEAVPNALPLPSTESRADMRSHVKKILSWERVDILEQ
jgi:hypothetical protein